MNTRPFATTRQEPGLSIPALPTRPQYGKFGRFGRFHDDGLLCVDATPRGFSYPACMTPFHVRWGEPQAPLAAVVPRIDPTEKQLAIQGGGEGAPRLIRYSLLFPGVAAWFGRRMVLHFVDNTNQPLRCAIDPSRVRRGDGILVVPNDRFPASPLLVVPPRLDSLKVWYDGANLTVEGAGDLGEVRFIPVCGLGRVDSLAAAWKQARRVRDLPVPTRTRSRAVVDSAQSTVAISEDFDGGIAPVSPLLMHAVDNGYPASVDGPVVRSGILTRWGEYVYIGGARTNMVLPIPEPEAPGLVRPAALDPRRVAHRDSILGMPADQADAQAPMALLEAMVARQRCVPLLPAESTRDLDRDWSRVWEAVLAKERWPAQSEPITGHAYSGIGAVPDDREIAAGQGVGAARVTAAMATYVRWSGDWAWAAKHKATLVRNRRFVDLADDWVWMCPSLADHGGSTGDGEALAAHYACAMAERFLTEGLGDTAGQTHAIIRSARLAVALSARFGMADYGATTKQMPKGHLVLGYDEKRGFVTADPKASDPALVSSFLGDAFSSGETTALYAGLARRRATMWLGEVSKARPRWFDPRLVEATGTRHRGNSIRVVWPHLLARLRIVGDGPGAAWPRWDLALGNRHGARTALALWAELACQSVPIRLIDWGQAGYRDGVMDPDGGGAALRFRTLEPNAWRLRIQCRPGMDPFEASISGKPVPIGVERELWEISTSVPAGEWELRIRWGNGVIGPQPKLSPGPVPPRLAPATLDLAPRNPAW